MKIITVVANKGGVGKTATVGTVAQGLSLLGVRVLLVDNDPQSNLSMMFDAVGREKTIKNLYDGEDIIEIAQEVENYDNITMISANSSFNNRGVERLKPTFIKDAILKEEGLADCFDYVFIDNPPGIEKLTQISVCSADEVWIPFNPSKFDMVGIAVFHKFMEELKQPVSKISRLIPTLIEGNKNEKYYQEQISNNWKDKVTKSKVKRCAVFKNMLYENKNPFLSSTKSNITYNYLDLIKECFDMDSKEVVKRLKRSQQAHKEKIRKTFIQFIKDRQAEKAALNSLKK